MFHLFLNKERHVNKSIANRLYTIALINQQIKTKTFYEIEFFVTLHPSIYNRAIINKTEYINQTTFIKYEK